MNIYSDESLECRWYREHSKRIHQKRLQDIKDRSATFTKSPRRYYSVNRRKVSKDHPKASEVYRENIILYDKLTMISERKCSPSAVQGPKSLNITVRKKEADRIIRDNLEFVKRLTEKESFVSARRFKDEYMVLEKYKQTISKTNLHERLKKITLNDLKLPPINQDPGLSTERSKKIGESKVELKADSSSAPINSQPSSKIPVKQSINLKDKHKPSHPLPNANEKPSSILNKKPPSAKSSQKANSGEEYSLEDSNKALNPPEPIPNLKLEPSSNPLESHDPPAPDLAASNITPRSGSYTPPESPHSSSKPEPHEPKLPSHSGSNSSLKPSP